MIAQIIIGIFGVAAIWLSQDPRIERRKFACLVGLVAQPAWFYATWKAEQYGIFGLCFLYTLSWLRGFWQHWIIGAAKQFHAKRAHEAIWSIKADRAAMMRFKKRVAWCACLLLGLIGWAAYRLMVRHGVDRMQPAFIWTRDLSWAFEVWGRLYNSPGRWFFSGNHGHLSADKVYADRFPGERCHQRVGESHAAFLSRQIDNMQIAWQPGCSKSGRQA